MSGLRVLQVLGRSAGGIARHVAQVSADLAAEPGFTVAIAGPADGPIPMPLPVIGLDIPDGPWGHRAAVRALRRVIEERKPDVVHAHGLRAGIDAGRAAPRGTSSLVTVHNLVRKDIVGPLRAVAYAWAETLAVRATDRTLCVSQEIATHLKSRPFVDPTKVSVAYLGIEPPDIAVDRRGVRAELGMPEETQLIVTASRLAPQKRLTVMLGALARVPDAGLAILGAGPEEEALKREVEEKGLSGRVRFLGFRDDVHRFIAAADVFCLSSVWEGIPLAVQEALALGTPVVATAVGGMPEIVSDGVSGRLVAPNDAAALGDALREVLEHPEVAERFALAAKLTLQERFSRSAMMKALMSTYREIARRA